MRICIRHPKTAYQNCTEGKKRPLRGSFGGTAKKKGNDARGTTAVNKKIGNYQTERETGISSSAHGSGRVFNLEGAGA